MKRLNKIIMLSLAVIMLMSALVSCELIETLTGSPSTPSPDVEQKPTHTHSYVNGKCECGKRDPDYVAPHSHIYFDGKCECGEINPDYVAPHQHEFVDGKCECGESDPNYVPPHRHEFVNGKCECGESDPNYIPPHVCESLCTVCYCCLDAECQEQICLTKCKGHTVAGEGYDYTPVISEVMPAIYINTPDGSNYWATRYSRSDKLAGRIEYVDATVSTLNCDEDMIITDATAEVKVRGNYTLDYAKKPIRIKFKSKTNLLGLHDGGKYKNWVLLADWKDLSMSNNALAFYLGNVILGSEGLYCTDFRSVEVYLNGQYWGVYLLVEQQEVKDDRTSVSEVEDDYTGNDIGYFFEYDGYYSDERNLPDGDPTFEMSYYGSSFSGIGYTVKSDIYADSQLEFLKTHMDNVYYIAYQATKGNFYKFDENYQVVPCTEETTAEEVVGNVINLDSLVGTYILNELANDPDIGWSSFYLSLDMSPDGSKKLNFEAPWDFDSCFGISNRINCSSTTGFFASQNRRDGNPWLALLANQDWYVRLVAEKWAEMKENGVQENVIKFLETQKTTYKDYYIKNYNRWSSRVTGGNSELISIINTFKDIETAQGLAAEYQINWLTERMSWLDSVWSDGTLVTPEVPDNAKEYTYEAENAELSGFTVADPVRYNRDYASNNSYVGQLTNGVSFTYTVNASEATTVHLFAGLSKRTYDKEFSSMFSVSVNGKTIFVPTRYLPAISGSEEDWHCFYSLLLTTIELEKGKNIIVFTTVAADTANFDYIKLYSTVELS